MGNLSKDDALLLFALEPESAFAAALAAALGVPLAPHEDRAFPDGECKLRPLCDPVGADCYVVCSLHGGPALSPHDKLMRLLMMIAVLRDHGASRVTAVVPYLAYARKDRRTKPWDPVTLRYVAQLFEAVGTSQLMVLEAHNVAAFQSALRCPTVQVEAHKAFDSIAAESAPGTRLAVVSPDPGGVKRAQLWRESLQQHLAREVGFAMVDKRRSAGVVSSQELVTGDVAGATVLLIDDLIASGQTLCQAAQALLRSGARQVMAFAAHGLFLPPAAQALAQAALAQVVVTDSVPAFRLAGGSPVLRKLRVVTCAPLFAQAIRRSHEGLRA